MAHSIAGQSTARARVLLVVQDELARAYLRGVLSGEPDLEVIAEAAEPSEALDQCRRLRPDLVVFVIPSPVLSWLSAVGLVARYSKSTRALGLAAHPQESLLEPVLRQGQVVHLLRGVTRRNVVTAVRSAAARADGLSPGNAVPLVVRLSDDRAESTALQAPPLTAREREVLRLVAAGRTNREIASSLVVSVSTVKKHVARILAKLGARDRTQAAVRALNLGVRPAPASVAESPRRAERLSHGSQAAHSRRHQERPPGP